MPTEDPVSAVDVLPVDGEPEAGDDLDDPVCHLAPSDCVVQLRVTEVGGVGGGEHRH